MLDNNFVFFCISIGRRALLIFLYILLTLKLHGQVEDMKELWDGQVDSTRSGILEIDYLEIGEDEILKAFNNRPNFGIYKDNYFLTGVPLNCKINSSTADAKFQISVQHRLTKTVLPYNTFLMLVYSQKSFWDIYSESSPFSDNNYNPGLHVSKLLIFDNKLKGSVSFGFEHESNGKDGMESRSHNYFLLDFFYYLNMRLSTQIKLWGGWKSSDNKNLYDYTGYSSFIVTYKSWNDRIAFSALLNPHSNFIDYNTQLEFSFKVNRNANQFLFVQWYQGYGEGLLCYDSYVSMLRFGFCIKPSLRSVF